MGRMAGRPAPRRSSAGSLAGVDLAVVGVVNDLPQADTRGERFVLDVERTLTPHGPVLHRIQLARYWPREGRAIRP